MKIAILVLAIIGGICSIGLGATWISDYNKYKDLLNVAEGMADNPVVAAQLSQLNGLVNSAYLMLVGGLASIVAAVMRGKLGKTSAIILLVAGVVPGLLAAKAFVATFFLIVAGALCFIDKPATT